MAGYLSTVEHGPGRVREFWSIRERNAWIVDEVVNQGRTLTSVGVEVGLTRERVRQIIRDETGQSRYASIRRELHMRAMWAFGTAPTR